MTERRCGNCRWFERFPSEGTGACRRNPPIDIDGSVPHTTLTDFCGEWADKTITPEQEDRQELTRQFALAISANGVCYSDKAVWEMATKLAAAEPQIQRENEQ